MGIFSKLSERLRKKREESESSADWKEMPSGIRFYSLHPVREGAKRITIDVLQNGDSVDIRMHGLEDVNVCLASFLTKGVSYAQEKYNEYKQSPKSEAEVEISESIMAALKEVAHNDARKGCKPIKRERE